MERHGAASGPPQRRRTVRGVVLLATYPATSYGYCPTFGIAEQNGKIDPGQVLGRIPGGEIMRCIRA